MCCNVDTDNSPKRSPKGTPKTRDVIVELMRKNPAITIAEIAAIVSINHKNGCYYLWLLVLTLFPYISIMIPVRSAHMFYISYVLFLAGILITKYM